MTFASFSNGSVSFINNVPVEFCFMCLISGAHRNNLAVFVLQRNSHGGKIFRSLHASTVFPFSWRNGGSVGHIRCPSSVSRRWCKKKKSQKCPVSEGAVMILWGTRFGSWFSDRGSVNCSPRSWCLFTNAEYFGQIQTNRKVMQLLHCSNHNADSMQGSRLLTWPECSVHRSICHLMCKIVSVAWRSALLCFLCYGWLPFPPHK